MRKIVVAVTGASGSIYAQRMLHHLQQLGKTQELEVGVVLSKNAYDVWDFELGGKPDISFKMYAKDDFFAPFASGSARYTDMVIVPCSMGTLGRIAHGFSENLITRAADVMLKERRRLICVLRDTPYSLIHIDNMKRASEAGAIMMPASPSFYSKPTNFEELADTVIHRVLDLMGFEPSTFRWGS